MFFFSILPYELFISSPIPFSVFQTVFLITSFNPLEDQYNLLCQFNNVVIPSTKMFFDSFPLPGSVKMTCSLVNRMTQLCSFQQYNIMCPYKSRSSHSYTQSASASFHLCILFFLIFVQIEFMLGCENKVLTNNHIKLHLVLRQVF